MSLRRAVRAFAELAADLPLSKSVWWSWTGDQVSSPEELSGAAGIPLAEAKVRYVRTQAGARKYGQPIGSPIATDVEPDAGRFWKRYKRGRDLTTEIEMTPSLQKDIKDLKFKTAQSRWDWPKKGDQMLPMLAHLQGWDAPANTGSSAELDKAVAAGGVEVWRGINGLVDQPTIFHPDHYGDETRMIPDPDWEKSSVPKFKKEAISGDTPWFGFGLYGNGNYYSADYDVAASFGAKTQEKDADGYLQYTNTPDHRAVQRIVIRPDARVVDFDDLVKLAHTRRDLPTAARSDAGHLAAILGYDVIQVRGKHDRDEDPRYADQYILLNRTAALFEEPA